MNDDPLEFTLLTLFFVALLFFIGAICEIVKPGSAVFHECTLILPPIATLVIGYYFGRDK